MSAREPIRAAFWWQTVSNQFETSMREFIGKARKTERNETGHDCGHRFEISVRSSLHVSGPGEHTDADYFDGNKPVTVRAHNLRDALLVAATLPLGEWFEDDGETP